MIKKILKIAPLILIGLAPGLPVLHDNLNQECIEQYPAHIDTNKEEDCNRIKIQLDHVSGAAILSGSKTFGF